ncbi:hypothetical protein [Vibrio sp. FJH11]
MLLITTTLLAIQFPLAALPPVSSFNQLSCTELSQNKQSSADKTRLDILIPAHTMALPLLSKLCENGRLSQQYSDIAVHWLPRQHVTPQTIYSQKFDVMWARDYQLAGLSPDYAKYYDKLLNLPGYDVLWFANQAIDDEFLKTHRIGLLNDTFSRSGYQLPMQHLKQLAVDATSAQISMYQTRKELLDGFTNGEVDVIAGTNYSALNQPEQKVHKAVIASGVSAGGWYISRSLERLSDEVSQRHLTQALGAIL